MNFKRKIFVQLTFHCDEPVMGHHINVISWIQDLQIQIHAIKIKIAKLLEREKFHLILWKFAF